MPYGRTPEEVGWFNGWYEHVIKLGIGLAGWVPIRVSPKNSPTALKEILPHLVHDPVVVVDLGGCTSDAEPDPQVIYQLGIRHGLRLPLVIMTWPGQRLPFDMGSQNVIKEDRNLIDRASNRTGLRDAIQTAVSGKFHCPLNF